MRIVHVVDYLMPTMGYQEFMLPKWNVIQGHEVHVVTSDRYYPVVNYSQTWGKILGERVIGESHSIIEGVIVHRLSSPFEFKARPWITNLSKVIKSIDPDIIMVHGTGSFSAYRSVKIAKSLKIPLLLDNHMIMDVVQRGILQSIYYSLHSHILMKYITNYAFKIIGVTEETCTYLELLERVPLKKIYLLPLCTDINIFNPQSLVQVREDQPIQIVQSGKLNDDKKPQWLTSAVIELIKKGFNVQLTYVGNGDPEITGLIRNQFDKLGFSNHLHFNDIMSLPDLAHVFRSSHFTIFPEGTSLSALEAAACGSVVIMADHPASKARMENGLGLVYKRGDIEDLVTSISSCINDAKKFSEIQERSMHSIRKNYTYEAISKQFITLCEDAISLHH